MQVERTITREQTVYIIRGMGTRGFESVGWRWKSAAEVCPAAAKSIENGVVSNANDSGGAVVLFFLLSGKVERSRKFLGVGGWAREGEEAVVGLVEGGRGGGVSNFWKTKEGASEKSERSAIFFFFFFDSLFSKKERERERLSTSSPSLLRPRGRRLPSVSPSCLSPFAKKKRRHRRFRPPF